MRLKTLLASGLSSQHSKSECYWRSYVHVLALTYRVSLFSDVSLLKNSFTTSASKAIFCYTDIGPSKTAKLKLRPQMPDGQMGVNKSHSGGAGFSGDHNMAKQGLKVQKNAKSSRVRLKKVIPSIPEKLKRDYFGKPKVYKLSSLNPFITCPICQGYLVDATTITECLHSFCRSCIVKHLERTFNCPLCNEMVHKTNPWYNLRSDTALQDIVGKLVPGLTEGEERRRKVFYKSRGLPVPEKVTKPDPPALPEVHVTPPPEVESPPESPPSYSRTMYHGDGQVTMQLEMKCVDEFTAVDLLPLKRKFVRCSAHVTIGLLQKFIARKLKLEAANQIEILCSDMELGTDFTLHYIKETIAAVKDHDKPLLLYYGLTQLE